MDINPYEARMRILRAQDQVQVQREAAPDAELAGCTGCPFFWTCPVPHRGEEVRVPREIPLSDVSDALPERSTYRPRDESDVGWTDVWIEDADEGAGIEDVTADERATGEGATEDVAARTPHSASSRDPQRPRRRWALRRSRRR